MPYIPNCKTDVFVSYSSIDNEALVTDGGQHRGWIDALLEKLRVEMRSRIGEREVKLSIDHEFIDSTLPLTPQILEQVRGAAVLLVVMSPAYLKSEWCRRERNAFLAAAQRHVRTGSMLVVRARPVARDAQPDEFRDLRGIEFFVPRPGARTEESYRVLGHPDANDLAFMDRICTLGQELSNQLRRLRSAATSYHSVPPGGTGVFVAGGTDDLEEREEELRGYLTQEGIHVLPSPSSRYPMSDLVSYEASVLQDLECCTLFAQLLGPTRGRRLEFAPGRRLPELQFDLARRANKPILQWRERSLELASIPDAKHRALLEGAQVRACGINEFKAAVVERAFQKPTRRRAQTSTQTVVFLNVNSPDRVLARDLGMRLSGLGLDCYWPIEAGAPETIRADLEENLRECDGLVLVYGETQVEWVHQQLRQTRKIISTRQRPLAAMALFDGPPREKPDIAAAIPDLITYNCRHGGVADALREFATRLGL